MKFNRFLSRFRKTSTSLVSDLPPVADPAHLTDQSFAHRQQVDRTRTHVKRYTESKLVQEVPQEVKQSVGTSRIEGRALTADTARRLQRIERRRQGAARSQAMVPPPRSASPAPTRHRFTEPPSRNHPG